MTSRMKTLIRLVAVICLGSHFLPGVELQPLSLQARANPSVEQPRSGVVLFIIERYGGFAGIREKFNINQDGRVTNEMGQTHQISADALEGIRRKVAALDVPKSCEIRVTPVPCSDCFQYRITLFGASGRRTIILDDPLSGSDSVSKIAKDLRDLVLGLKWK